MPFFNRLCSTSPLAAKLAIRTNAAVIPSAVFTSGFAKWRELHEEEIPYDPANPEQLTADITAADGSRSSSLVCSETHHALSGVLHSKDGT
jgi:lauroyl/myristoyl acyltransferase